MNIIVDPEIGSATAENAKLDMDHDLTKSGLTSLDLLCRPLDAESRNALSAQAGTRGYVIPYFNLAGKMLPFYRCKVLNSQSIKYLQPPETSNYVYFPKTFYDTWKADKFKTLILTEGEKKAAKACKEGFPTIAFGGVDSWRNRTIVIPKASEVKSLTNVLSIKLPSADFDERWMSSYAIGLEDVLDICRDHGTTIYICYDTDTPSGPTAPVQKAAARLGYELRYLGFAVTKIRQLILPFGGDKASLDDLLVSSGADELARIIKENSEFRTTFPRHPAIREFVARQLQKTHLDRKQISALSLAVITELDARGSRMYSSDEKQMYYFNSENKHLMRVNLNTPSMGGLNETEFGSLMYKQYGISPQADQRFMQWFNTQFSAEDPVETVSPHRIIARHHTTQQFDERSTLRYQINNGQYIKVTGDLKAPYRILPNGAENVLFESQMDEIKAEDIIAALQEIHQNQKKGAPIPFQWREVLGQVRIRKSDRTVDILAMLYYLSPWLLRWNGLQLPVELVVGEAGSGKSTLFTLRLGIIHGENNADLRNTPNDQKDWYAALANSGGLHITDNVHMTDKGLKQRISDDLCRLVTEPEPKIRVRKYYTEADERTIRVDSVFGFTAITQPFPNGDLLQRALIMELSKGFSQKMDPKNASEEVTFDSYWKEHQMAKFGGRTKWVAHQLYVIHRFFELADRKWSRTYKSKHRLIGFEQALLLMAELFGLEDGEKWIPETLVDATYRSMEHADWTLEGLAEYAHEILEREKRDKAAGRMNEKQKKLFSASDVAQWAQDSDDYSKIFQLINSRSLGRYIISNKYNVQQVTGITEHSDKNGKMHYIVVERPKGESDDAASE